MKKKIALGMMLILFVVVLAGCGKKETAIEDNQPNQNETEEKWSGDLPVEENEDGFLGKTKTSLKNLMGAGENMKCEWKIEDEASGVGNGTVYVSGEKFRQDMEIVEEGQTMKMHIISDGQWIYQWNSTTKEGVKMSMNEIEKMETESTDQTENQAESFSTEDFEEEFEYDCDRWVVDNSLFKVPSDVQFSDMTEMIKTFQEGSENMMTDMCKMCETLPPSAKEECLKSCQE